MKMAVFVVRRDWLCGSREWPNRDSAINRTPTSSNRVVTLVIQHERHEVRHVTY